MNIVVCVKQVPDTTDVKIDPETRTLVREGVPSIVNPFDMFALEEGLRIRERRGGKVTALSMGPPQAAEALREAIAMGIDGAVLVSDRAFAGADTLATSYTLSLALQKIGDYDLVLCGRQASDGDTAQVGPGIAECLDIPQVTLVRKIEEFEDGYARVQRMTEEGYEVVQTPLPAVFTVVKEINEPRLPTLRGQLRAKSAQIPVWTVADLEADPTRIGLDGSPTWVMKVFSPEPRGAGLLLQGEAEELVEKLVAGLRSGHVI
jgi:electron transfer flavoprotein beta subunit